MPMIEVNLFIQGSWPNNEEIQKVPENIFDKFLMIRLHNYFKHLLKNISYTNQNFVEAS